MKNDYLKFLQVLCSLYDGENYVPESEIRKRWPECPSHNAIQHLGRDIYFEWNQSLSKPGYIPLPLGFNLLKSSLDAAELASLVQDLHDQFETDRQERKSSERVAMFIQWA